MPFVPNDPNNPEQQQQTGQPQGGAPIPTSAAPGSGPTAGNKAAAPQANPSQPFQNLQAYLSANAPQIQQQADTISGNLNQQYGQTTAAIDKATGDFGTQVAGGYTAPNADVVSQAAKNPTEFASDPNNVANFQKQWNDTYTGPSSFEGTQGYDDVNKQVEQAASSANLVNNNSGLKTYLQNANGGQYTEGDSILDAALLRGNPGAITQVKNAAQPFSGLSDYLSGKVTSADQGVTTAQQAAQSNAKNVQDQFTGANGVIPTFQNTVNEGVTAAQKQAADKAEAVKTSLASGSLDPQTLADLGLTPQELTGLLGEVSEVQKGWSPTIGNPGNSIAGMPVNLSQWLTPQNPEVQINRGNFATPEQYAEAAALSKLTGQDLSSFLDPTQASQAGTANLNLSQFNKQGAFDYLDPLYSAIEKAKFASNPIPGNPGIPVMPGTPIPSIKNKPGTVQSGGGQYTWTDPEGKVHGAF